MSRYLPIRTFALLATLLPLAAASAASAAPSESSDALAGTVEFQYSPYTYHFSPSSEHAHVQLVGLTMVRDSGWMWGGAAFRNSFAQPSAYVFGGQRYEEPFGWRRVYWNWSAGIVYGYKPPYENKVPINWHGFTPVVIPAVGYRITPALSAQLSLLGTAAVMLQFVYALDQAQGAKAASVH